MENDGQDGYLAIDPSGYTTFCESKSEGAKNTMGRSIPAVSGKSETENSGGELDEQMGSDWVNPLSPMVHSRRDSGEANWADSSPGEQGWQKINESTNQKTPHPDESNQLLSDRSSGDWSDGFGQSDSKLDFELEPSATLRQPSLAPAFDAGNATKKPALDEGEMPQSNATNATMESAEIAVPSEWGKLWRMVKNGSYYYYELRFINADRIRRPGGKITPPIARKLAKRKGKGRHKESRKDADRLRDRAFDIAKRIQ